MAKCSLGFDFGKVDEVQDLTIDIAQVSPLFLNFWMTKFMVEIGKRSGNKTVVCLSFLRPCFALIGRFSVVFYNIQI